MSVADRVVIIRMRLGDNIIFKANEGWFLKTPMSDDEILSLLINTCGGEDAGEFLDGAEWILGDEP